MGPTATSTPEDRRPGPNSAGRPPSTAGHQPSRSETRPYLGRFPSPITSPSPIETRTATSTARRGKGRFPHAGRRAGRDPGFWRTSHAEY